MPRGLFKLNNNVFQYKTSLLVYFLLILIFPSTAQDATNSPPEITAENISQLQSVATIDFDDYGDEIGEMTTGWFGLNLSGDYFVIVNQDNHVSVLDIAGNYVGGYEIIAEDDANMLVQDIHFVEGWNNAFTTIHTDGENHKIAFVAINGNLGELININTIDYPFTPDSPIALWTSEDNSGERSIQNIYVETIPNDPTQTPYIAQFSIWADATLQTDDDGNTLMESLPYKPATDPDALIRIGRIPLPFIVTSSPEGTVKRWHIAEQSNVIEAQVENGPAVFGQINISGSHFTWRDPLSENINLLNFETGENQIVAPLDGEYFNWFFVSNDASVILGLTPEERPEIVAWIVEKGERILVGEYRECSRQPDMVRLSSDGTTLVIGCDTGLDVWRVVND